MTMELNVDMFDDCLESIDAYNVLDCIDTRLSSLQLVIRLASRLVMELDNTDPRFDSRCEEISLLLDGWMEFNIPMMRGMTQAVMKMIEPAE